MGKSRRGAKEFTREQRLNHENQRLKREIGRLRKELARMDLDRYGTVKEIIEEQFQEERAAQGQQILENLKNTWACSIEGCGGHLEIFTFNKVGSTWYYRICSNAPRCKNRTKSQKYTPDVKGIMKKTD